MTDHRRELDTFMQALEFNLARKDFNHKLSIKDIVVEAVQYARLSVEAQRNYPTEEIPDEEIMRSYVKDV